MEYYGKIFILEYLETWTSTYTLRSGKRRRKITPAAWSTSTSAEGVPFYELTEAGLVVASSIEEIDDRLRLLKSYITSMSYTNKDESMMLNRPASASRYCPFLYVKNH